MSGIGNKKKIENNFIGYIEKTVLHSGRLIISDPAQEHLNLAPPPTCQVLYPSLSDYRILDIIKIYHFPIYLWWNIET